MRVGKQDATFSESIEIRGASLGMSAEASDPIIQVVQGDEKNIRPLGRGFIASCKLRQARKQQKADDDGPVS